MMLIQEILAISMGILPQVFTLRGFMGLTVTEYLFATTPKL